MTEEPKTVKKLREFWLSHNKCVIVGMAGLCLLFLIGWIADRSTDSSRYLGTASTVLSIVLSLVVIGYTLVQNVATELTSDRIGRLLERLEQRMLRIGEDVGKILGQEAMRIHAKGSDVPTEVGKNEVYFSLLNTSDIARLFACFLLRSHKLRKHLHMDQFVAAVDPLVKMSTAELSSHAYGMLHGMVCCLKGFLSIEDQSMVQLVTLPTNFEDHVAAIALWMKERDPGLAECIKVIAGIT